MDSIHCCLFWFYTTHDSNKLELLSTQDFIDRLDLSYIVKKEAPLWYNYENKGISEAGVTSEAGPSSEEGDSEEGYSKKEISRTFNN